MALTETSSSTETIAALATATGQGGVGIVRVSGPKSKVIAEAVIGFEPKLVTHTSLPFLILQVKKLMKASRYSSKGQIPLPEKMFLNYKAMVDRLS